MRPSGRNSRKCRRKRPEMTRADTGPDVRWAQHPASRRQSLQTSGASSQKKQANRAQSMALVGPGTFSHWKTAPRHGTLFLPQRETFYPLMQRAAADSRCRSARFRLSALSFLLSSLCVVTRARRKLPYSSNAKKGTPFHRPNPVWAGSHSKLPELSLRHLKVISFLLPPQVERENTGSPPFFSLCLLLASGISPHWVSHTVRRATENAPHTGICPRRPAI